MIPRVIKNPAVSLTPRIPNFSNDYLDFLGEYEAICETALAPESEPYRGDCLMKKTDGRKYRGTALSTNKKLHFTPKQPQQWTWWFSFIILYT
jgi:hypothetical protein